MNWTTYSLAWLLPAFSGSGIWLALSRGPRERSDWLVALGAGWIVGLFLAGSLARWTGESDTQHAFAHAAIWLGAIGLLAWMIVIRLRFRSTGVGSGLALREFSLGSLRKLPPWMTLVCLALLALIVVRLWSVGSEALLRPAFPWDAWSAWSIKPKTWFLLGHAVPYVSMSEWLKQPDLATHSLASWDYPELLAWVELWFASAAGAWNEPLIDIAWCGVLAALLLAAYGQWRAIGMEPWRALALTYALASLPLVDAHVALAGYADLWLAATFGLAVLAWSRWLARREAGQWLLAIALALWLPAIKLEGAVWLLAFAMMVGFERVPLRWRWRLVMALAVAALVALFVGDLVLPLPGLGLVQVTWEGIRVPAIGSLDFSWHPVGRSMIASLFTLPNWHLLWYLIPVLVIWRWRRIREDPPACMLGALLALCALLLLVLFFFTNAAAWAADYTSANRLILQIVPVAFAFAGLLLRNRAGGIPDRLA
ncbi:MAG: hypothetical protein WBV61_04455 [Rhodanobacteraceae bacterium]